MDKLNSKQLEAVNAIEGPVLVIAGPGTGKTQLLSMRVANILKKTDADPENILCLTFTNKSATNMRDRLVSLIGVEARKVQVRTFHSFAAEIMNQYPDFFWNGAKLSTAPETTQLEIIQRILSDLPHDNPLASRFAGKFTAIPRIMQALKLTKETGLTPDKLQAIVEVNLAYIDKIEDQLIKILAPTLSLKRIPDLHTKIMSLPEQGIGSGLAPLLSLTSVIQESLEFAIDQDLGTDRTKAVSKWKTKWLQSVDSKKGMHNERNRNLWWLELVDVYQKYREQLHYRGYYDYSDMLVEVLAQLEQNPELLSEVQEKFRYVLIDEFQDSNAAQLRLAHLVANHESANGRPNIMAVGDDDQSIFGFNGAELNNMLFFDRNYKDVKKIVLDENYRSTQAILDTTSKIIDQAGDRLVKRDKSLSKKLIAKKEISENGEIRHISYPTREHQLSEVAREIKKRWAKNNNESIAVLARHHGSLQALSSILLNIGVPVSYELRSNILEHEAVKQAIIIAKIVGSVQNGDKELANELLCKALRHPMWGIPPEDLWKLALANYSKPDWMTYLLTSKNPHLKQIGKHFVWLAAQADKQPLASTIEYILGLRSGEQGSSPLKKYFSARRSIDNDYLQTLSALRILRELVTEFSRTTTPTLGDFLKYIQLNEDNRLGVVDESPFVSDEKAVELYTVHKAKGLEFDCVFIIDTIEENWQPKTGRYSCPSNLPLQPPLENDDDYARLLYVAATRAKHTLIATSYDFDHAGKELLPTPLIREAIGLNTKKDKTLATDPIIVLEESLRWPHLNRGKEKELIKAKLESFSINVTNLLNFLDVTQGGPEYFFERNVLRLPEAKTATLAYGSAVHASLDFGQKLVNSDSFSLVKLLDTFAQELRGENLPRDEHTKYLARGQKMFKKLFGANGFVLPKGSKSEQRIKDVKLSSAIIDGKLDRVDKIDDRLTIVDYKTGSPLSGFETSDQSKAIKAWKQKTQLIFYALIIKNDLRFGKPSHIEGEMVYVEASQSKDLVRTYIPTLEDVERLNQLVEAVWRKINDYDLPDVSKYTPDISGIAQFEEDLINNIL
ncbi:hypothetical protein A3F37_02505 [Candidatus Saccharibacteria bacterium RIFCSPHIGHO2_12_FULL_41_12]|nr:MAG: hypothetical protein A3F37_02505 [Candidatus Saccharibacteria bacterium RIFCSPHIGHO2_12_FULL_41_12]